MPHTGETETLFYGSFPQILVDCAIRHTITSTKQYGKLELKPINFTFSCTNLHRLTKTVKKLMKRKTK